MKSQWKIVLDYEMLEEVGGDWQMAATLNLLRNEQQTNYHTKHYVDEDGNAWFRASLDWLTDKLHFMGKNAINLRLKKLAEMGFIEFRENWKNPTDRVRMIRVVHFPNRDMEEHESVHDARGNTSLQTTNTKSKERFAEFWNLYGNKVGRKKAFASWSKMTEEDQIAAITAVPAYLKTVLKKGETSTEFKPQQQMPQFWLSQRRWEDENVQTGERLEVFPEIEGYDMDGKPIIIYHDGNDQRYSPSVVTKFNGKYYAI